MSIFILPTSLVDAIEKMLNGFWWGHGGLLNMGMHVMSWDKLTVHKNNGDMGFKDLKYFNISMLHKQWWKLQTDKHSLVSRLFKARYFPNNNYFGSRIDHNLSYVRRNIFSAKIMVRGGACWCIGIGSTIPLISETCVCIH